MRIENRDVVGKLTDYLNHRVSLSELVDWAERHQDQAARCTSVLIFEPILRSATASSYLV